MRRFLRDINNLAKFCSELSSVTQLQYNLTKEDMPFLWSTRHQQAFDSAKVLATCAACLAYFYVTVPLILQVDASDYGRGAALLQTIKLQSSSALDESSLRPIAYCKRPVTTEESYAQIEKESVQTTYPFSQSSRRTSPQRLSVCKRCCFSYSVTTLLLCTEKDLS